MWGVPHIYWVNLGASATLLAIVVYLMAGPAEHRVVRIARAHRWETFLMLGIPAGTGCLVAMLPWALAHIPTSLSLWWWLYIVRWLVMAVLVMAYPFIRRHGHEFLTILWGFAIATTATGLFVDLAAAARSAGTALPLPVVLFKFPADSWTVGETYFSPIVNFRLGDALRLVVMFWFIRRAARISMAHAFLLLGLSMADRAFSTSLFWPFLSGTDTVLVAAAHLVAQVALNVLMLWALIRHETLTASALRATAAATIVASETVGLMGGVLWRAITAWPIIAGVQPGNIVFSLPGVAEVIARGAIGLLPVLALGYLFARTVRPRTPGEEIKDVVVQPE